MNNYSLEKEYFRLEERLGFYFGRLISYPLIPPEHVYFSLTNRCNLRCKMCDISKNSDNVEDELTTKEVKNIIQQIKEMGIKHLIFSGGEPFLRKDLLEILEFAVKNDIEMVDIITNGILLNDHIIQKLIEIKLNHITFSLDGLRDTNDEIRGKEVFKKVEINIDKLNYYKSKFNLQFPTVGINFTIMNRNINDILPMIDYAQKKHCNILVLQPVLFNNTKMYEKKKNFLWPSRVNIINLKNIMKEVLNLKEKLTDLYIYTDKKILEAIPDYFEGKKLSSHFKCYEAVKRIVITYNGKLWSCLGIYGDLRKKSLKENWFSKEVKKIRNNVKKCKAHCLQDCVYLPSDVLEEVRKFLKRLKISNDEEKIRLKNRLLEKIEYYINILFNEKEFSFPYLIKWFIIKKDISSLNLLRKEVNKI